MKNALKSKSGLVALVDKLKPLADQDGSCKQPPGCSGCSSIQSWSKSSLLPQLFPRTVDKLEALVSILDKNYELLSDYQAEGKISGYTKEFLVASFHTSFIHKSNKFLFVQCGTIGQL